MLETVSEIEAHRAGLGRRHFLLSAATSAAAATVAALATAERAEAEGAGSTSTGSVAWRQPGNNEHILALGRDKTAATDGKVVIDYFGHCALRITSPKGLTLLFDPWRNDPSGAWGLWFSTEFPRIVVDVALSTHSHFDHDAIDKVDATAVLDRLVGTWSFGDVTVTGVPDKHATDNPGSYKWINAVKESGADPYPPHNPGHLDMVTYVVETGGIRILVWGDNRHNPPEDVWRAWGKIDVLTLPVDGSWHCLSYDQGNSIVDRLKPKIVIPTHYLMAGVTSTLSTLQSADAWVDAQASKRRPGTSRLVLDGSGIADLDRQFVYFADSVTRG